MPPKFCQRQTLLFYVESEPQGTSPVPNVESLIFTPWKYAICPDRDLHPEPSDWHTCVLTMRPPQLSVMLGHTCTFFIKTCLVAAVVFMNMGRSRKRRATPASGDIHLPKHVQYKIRMDLDNVPATYRMKNPLVYASHLAALFRTSVYFGSLSHRYLRSAFIFCENHLPNFYLI